ncbi:hypothetical protein GCM10022222_76760 [Amycolatopsis ultiminotia]|uniref:Uncharacterized protein n=1 Tax=Amycolatopsis ultiminotia TaxID=543629 RepID=A0ABP6YD95_9PSEU
MPRGGHRGAPDIQRRPGLGGAVLPIPAGVAGPLSTGADDRSAGVGVLAAEGVAGGRSDLVV